MYTVLLLLSLAGEIGLLARTTRELSYDDAYITYTYAVNFAEGRGLTWNGARIVGTSSPASAVLLGALEDALPVGVASWGARIYWLAIFGIGAVLLVVPCDAPSGAARALAAFLLPLTQVVAGSPGSEYAWATLAVVLALVAVERGAPIVSGLLGGVACCVRPDLAVAPLAVAAWALGATRETRRGALRALAATVVVVLGWTGALALATGSALPTTLAAKRAQGASVQPIWEQRSGWRAVPVAGAELLGGSVDVTRATLWTLALGIASASVARRRGGIPPFERRLAGVAIVHLVVLALLAVPLSARYLMPAVLALVLFGAQAVAISASRSSAAFALRCGAALVLLLAIRPELRFGAFSPAGEAQAREATKLASYRQLATYLLRFPPERTAAFWEVGVLGYETRRPVLDYLGLVSPVPRDPIRRFRLSENRELLDPDLVPLSLRAPRFVRSTVGDLTAFRRDYLLDHLQLDTAPAFAVYRRHRVPGLGEVESDLVSDAPAGARVEVVDRPAFVALAVLVDPGGAIRVAADRPGEELCWIEPRVGMLEEPGAGTSADLAPATIRRRAVGSTTLLACATDPSSETMAVRCPAGAAAPCELPLLHLRRSAVHRSVRAP